MRNSLVLCLPGAADLARQEVADEQVVQVAFEFAERQHHMLSDLQRLDDLADRVRGGFVHDIGLVEQAAQLVVQAFGGGHVHAVSSRPGGHTVGMRHFLDLAGALVFHFDLFAVHGLEAAEPVLRPKGRDQRLQRGGRGLAQVQFARQQFHVSGQNVTRGDLQVEVRGRTADGRSRSQPDHAHLRSELGLQAGHAQSRVRSGVVISRTRCACRRPAPRPCCSASARPAPAA